VSDELAGFQDVNTLRFQTRRDEEIFQRNELLVFGARPDDSRFRTPRHH